MADFGVRFGQLIRRYRDAQGLTAGELAEMALGDAAKRSRVSELENGRVARPQAKTIDAFVVYFNIPPEEVQACREPPPEPSEDYDLPRELLENVVLRFGHSNPDAPEAELVAFLKETAKEWQALKERLAGLEAMTALLSGDDTAAGAHFTRACGFIAGFDADAAAHRRD